MSGGMDLDMLIREMDPVLHPEHYVFATTKDQTLVADAQAKMVFHEAEGTTLILLKCEAERLGVEGEFLCQMITLNVHSSLEAVGFVARIAMHLSRLGMGVNPVAGFYHDHLFIQVDKVPDAMDGLRELVAAV